MMKKNTQQSAVYRYMQTHKRGITSKEAFELFGCTRLSGVIKNLKNLGIKNIVSTREVVKTRYGNVSIARYTLEE